MLIRQAVLPSVVITLLLTGCSSYAPEHRSTMSRFDNPEVYSKPFHFRASIGLDSENQISSDSSIVSDSDSELRLDASMSLGKGFELGYASGSGRKFSLKYQFDGKNREFYEPGNVSQAVSIGYGQTAVEDGALFSKEQFWTQEGDFVDLAWIAGYRVTREFQVYGGLFYQTGNLDLDYYRYEAFSYNDTDKACTERPDGSSNECFLRHENVGGTNYGANVGIEYRILPWMSAMIEAAHSRAEWYDRDNSETAMSVNLSFHF